MRYRSDVAIWFNKEAYERMPLDVETVLKVLESDECEKASGSILFEMFAIKWDENSPSVRKVNDFINSLDENKNEFFEFVRIGLDDDDDIEHNSNKECFSMYIVRSIMTDQCL